MRRNLKQLCKRGGGEGGGGDVQFFCVILFDVNPCFYVILCDSPACRGLGLTIMKIGGKSNFAYKMARKVKKALLIPSNLLSSSKFQCHFTRLDIVSFMRNGYQVLNIMQVHDKKGKNATNI